MKQPMALHRHIAAMNAAFAAAGFTARLSGDSAAYRAAVAAIEGYHIYSPLDDAMIDLKGDMLWVGIEDGDGKLVAVEAGRLVKAPKKAGGLNGILSDRVFGWMLPVVERLPPVNLTGRLAYLGGAWVEPTLRGRGIMSLTLKLTVAHLVRCFGVKAVFGFVRTQHAGLSLAPDGYGFTSASVVDLMYLPGEAAADRLCMVWTDKGVLKQRFDAPAAYGLRPAKAKPERRSGRRK